MVPLTACHGATGCLSWYHWLSVMVPQAVCHCTTGCLSWYHWLSVMVPLAVCHGKLAFCHGITGCLSVSVSVSAQDGIVALGKAHTRSAPSLSSLPKVALETVPIFAWLNTDRCRPWRVECRPLSFSTPLSFRRSML